MARTRLQTRDTGGPGVEPRLRRIPQQSSQRRGTRPSESPPSLSRMSSLDADAVLAGSTAHSSALLQSAASQGNQQVLETKGSLPDLFSLPSAGLFAMDTSFVGSEPQAACSGRSAGDTPAAPGFAVLPLASSDMLFERGMEQINWQASSEFEVREPSQDLGRVQTDCRRGTPAAFDTAILRQGADPSDPPAGLFSSGTATPLESTVIQELPSSSLYFPSHLRNPFADAPASSNCTDSLAPNAIAAEPPQKRRRHTEQVAKLPAPDLPLMSSLSAPAGRVLPNLPPADGALQGMSSDIIALAQQRLSSGTMLTPRNAPLGQVPNANFRIQRDRIQESLNWARQTHLGRRESLEALDSRQASAPAVLTSEWQGKQEVNTNSGGGQSKTLAQNSSQVAAFRQAVDPIRWDPMIPWGSRIPARADVAVEQSQASEITRTEGEAVKKLGACITKGGRKLCGTTGYRVRSNELRVSCNHSPTPPILATPSPDVQAPSQLTSATEGATDGEHDRDGEKSLPEPSPAAPESSNVKTGKMAAAEAFSAAPLAPERHASFRDGLADRISCDQHEALAAAHTLNSAEVTKVSGRQPVGNGEAGSVRSSEPMEVDPPMGTNMGTLQEGTQEWLPAAQCVNPNKLQKFLGQLQTIQAKASRMEAERHAVAMWASAVEKADEAVAELLKDLQTEGVGLEAREARLKAGAKQLSELMAAASALKRVSKESLPPAVSASTSAAVTASMKLSQTE